MMEISEEMLKIYDFHERSLYLHTFDSDEITRCTISLLNLMQGSNQKVGKITEFLQINLTNPRMPYYRANKELILTWANLK